MKTMTCIKWRNLTPEGQRETLCKYHAIHIIGPYPVTWDCTKIPVITWVDLDKHKWWRWLSIEDAKKTHRYAMSTLFKILSGEKNEKI